MKKTLIALSLLCLLCIPAVKDLFKPAAYTSHDLTHHIVRTIHMNNILHDGQFPPRWTDQLNYGFGYPLFIFNYPLPSFLASLVHDLGFSFIWSVKIVMAASMVLSAVAAFILFNYWFKDELSGLIGALFYLYAPIRFLNIYVSATFGNAVAFMFIPLIFWALLKAYRGEFNKISFIIGSLSLSGLILSHNIMALMFLPVVTTFGLFLLFSHPNKKYFQNSVFLAMLGSGLSSFFLLPALFEKKLIRYDAILPDFYKTHFPTIKQLLHSPWGYGFSHPGSQADAMSFQIGLAHIMVFFLALLTLKFKFNFKNQLIFFICLFAFTVFLMLPISIPVWDLIPFMPYLQMPWRLLAVSVFAVSVLSAGLIALLPFKSFTTVLLCLAVLIANRNHLRINQILPVDDSHYLNINNSTTMASEHLPKGAQKFDNFPQADSKLTIIQGNAQIKINKDISDQVEAQIQVASPSIIRFNQIYFPNWQYQLNSSAIRPYIDEKYPLPEFKLQPGQYTFLAQFKDTPIRQIADIISILSLSILGLTFVYEPIRSLSHVQRRKKS